MATNKHKKSKQIWILIMEMMLIKYYKSLVIWIVTGESKMVASCGLVNNEQFHNSNIQGFKSLIW